MTVAVPVAAFSADHVSWEAPIAIQFTDASSWTPDTRWWDFGDGNFSDLQSPLHTYYFKGTYTVSLYVNNSAWEDTETKASYLTFVETTPGQTNIDNEVEWRRWARTFPPIQDVPTRAKKIDYADAGDRSIPDVYE